jgi:hypothetical protein
MIIESPTNELAQQEVDLTHKAARVSARPLDHVLQQHVGGHYRLAARSGILTGAGIIADAPLFSLRWSSAQLQFVLLYLEAYLLPTVVFTAAQELGIAGILASGFTAPDSAGTAILPGTSNRTRRNGMSISQVADMRIGSVTLLTAGTRVLDANDFIAGSGVANVVNAAAGTAYVNPSGGEPPFGFRYQPRVTEGEHPIVLAANEGLIIRNKIAFPAAGAATLIVNIGWAEVPQY